MQFILAITEHRVLGFVLAPYLVKRVKGQEYLEVYDRVTLQSIKSYECLLTPEQVQIVNYIENYNNQHLFSLFCKKKKQTPRDFVELLDGELLEEHVRPYVEKQIALCYKVMEYNPVPVFYKLLQNKIYLTEKVNVIDRDCEVVFNFKRSSEGIEYKLTLLHKAEEIHLIGKEAFILTNEPCSITFENDLYILNEIDAKKLIPFLTKESVNIGKQTEKKYLQTFVRSAIAKYKVNVEGIRIENLDSAPKPVISLEKNLEGKLSLVLKFIYNEKSIYYANRKSSTKVSCDFEGDDVVFTLISRDYHIENEKISRLLSYGLINKDGPFFEPIEKKGKKEGVFGSITWLNYNKDLLTKNGFDVAQSNLEKAYYLDTLKLNIEASEESKDWFDIKAVVEFDGFKIPFVEFKEHIVQGMREFVLPNNKIMILPEEWFESYSDLVNFSSVEGEKLKLQKQHFSILNTKGSRLSESFRDNLKQLLQSTDDSLEVVPEAVNAELRPYQQEGYSWMYRLYQNGFSGCLADDMGLGKTLQTLTLLTRVADENISEDPINTTAGDQQLDLFSAPPKPKKRVKTSLIIVPTSLIHNWLNEVNKFVPEMKAVVYSGQNRGLVSEKIEEADLLITSYGVLRNDLEQFEKISFLYVILDESQMIKNPGSKTFLAVMKLDSDYRLILTGTPIENSLSDLWAQFNFLSPGLLGNLNFFQSEFQYPIERKQDENKRDRLQQLVAPFILRRTKTQVASDLPPLSEQIISCELDEVQESIYEREKSKARKLVLENINKHGLKRATMQVLKSLMKLRQIANHPLLVDETYLAGSGKFDEITRNLVTLHNEGHKALVFSSFVKHLDLISNWLDEQGINYTTLTGETRDREKVVEEFQNDSNCSFFLVSLKAGGVGLNLTAASYVLMLDPWWNPAAEKQALNRAHRIGQEKNVNVYRFISQNTLEEKILKLQDKKNELADIFVNENAFNSITEEEIMELFE